LARGELAPRLSLVSPKVFFFSAILFIVSQTVLSQSQLTLETTLLVLSNAECASPSLDLIISLILAGFSGLEILNLVSSETIAQR